jgi:hypothetical protein
VTTPNDKLKALAKEEGLRTSDLLVLATQNDPFNAGTPADVRDAEWFARYWHAAGFQGSAHIRRLHYRMVESGATFPNGTPYRNTVEASEKLNRAAKKARELGLVDPSGFVDRRNKEVICNIEPRDGDPEPTWEWDEPAAPMLPFLPVPRLDDFRVGGIEVEGYDYTPADQPVLVEVWIEKTTMDDVLVPLCERLNINLVRSAGFQSITNAVKLLERIERHDKPARILYISDFDPAGDHMPVATARHLEFWIEEYALSADVKLIPIALTRQQVAEYDLPRSPIKESDRRAKAFEDRRGEGAVELDALEAIHPGVLAEIVSDAVSPYIDEDLANRLEGDQWHANDIVQGEWRDHLADEQQALDEIRDEIRQVLDRRRPEIERIAAEIAEEVEPHRDRLDRLWHAVEAKVQTFEPELPDRSIGEHDDTIDLDALFDSNRDFLDQLDAYRWHSGGSR